MSNDLYWHCLRCGDSQLLQPTGDPAQDYALGDHEPCECGGTAHVVTLRMGACYEQGRALGMSISAAWERALRQRPHAGYEKGGV